MFRKSFRGVEFIFDNVNDETELKDVLKETHLVYYLYNALGKEYIGKTIRTLDSRLSSHAHKISIDSNEPVYKNGLNSSKRVHIKILKKLNSKEETRLCEHLTILNRRKEIAEARGVKLTEKQLTDKRYAHLYNDILVNVIS